MLTKTKTVDGASIDWTSGRVPKGTWTAIVDALKPGKAKIVPVGQKMVHQVTNGLIVAARARGKAIHVKVLDHARVAVMLKERQE